MGQLDFVIGGAMIGGFGLLAAPADYRVTGVKTFIVGPDGKVYEKDLGKDTLKIFQAMDRYNPDQTWHETTDDLAVNDAGGQPAPAASMPAMSDGCAPSPSPSPAAKSSGVGPTWT